jgi:hypothetical protein
LDSKFAPKGRPLSFPHNTDTLSTAYIRSNGTPNKVPVKRDTRPVTIPPDAHISVENVPSFPRNYAEFEICLDLLQALFFRTVPGSALTTLSECERANLRKSQQAEIGGIVF